MSLNRENEASYLFDPTDAWTIEAISVTRIVVFAVIRGETVAFGGPLVVPQTKAKAAFDQEQVSIVDHARGRPV